MTLYKDSDFVDVVDVDGKPQPHPIPKQWLDTELAPGMKRAPRTRGSSASSDAAAEKKAEAEKAAAEKKAEAEKAAAEKKAVTGQ